MRQCVAVIQPATIRHLERLLASRGIALVMCSIPEMLARLDDGAADTVLIDPSLVSDDDTSRLRTALRDRPRCTVLYTPLIPACVRRVADLSRQVELTVVMQTAYSGDTELVRALSEAPPRLTLAFVRALRPYLDHLPAALNSVTLDALHGRAGDYTPTSLARRAGLTRRSVDRWLVRIGITSPRLLLLTPGVLRAAGLLQETLLPLRAIASHAGFRSTRLLEAHCHALLGRSAMSLRELPSSEDVVRRALRAVLRPAVSWTATGAPAGMAGSGLAVSPDSVPESLL